MLKELFADSADFTEANFKVPQISEHFSAMQLCSEKNLFCGTNSYS